MKKFGQKIQNTVNERSTELESKLQEINSNQLESKVYELQSLLSDES